MKIKVFCLILLVAASTTFADAQDKYPLLNGLGTIFDEYEHVIGWISKQGIVQNANDDRIAVVDRDGNAFDSKGQRIGKMGKDGIFRDAHGNVVFTVTEPADQHCKLVNREGKIIGIVHEHYRTQAAAIPCLFAGTRGL